MIGTSLLVRHLRHGRRHDPDRHPAGAAAGAGRDDAARHHADGVERLARLLWRARELGARRPAHPFRQLIALTDLVVHALRAEHARRAAAARGSRHSRSGWCRRITGPTRNGWQQGILYGLGLHDVDPVVAASPEPLVDQFNLGGKLDRREIIATKAACQVLAHAAKLVYFGALVNQTGSLDPIVAALAVVSSMIGTTLAKRVLEAMSDQQYRRWANLVSSPRSPAIRGPRHGADRVSPTPTP